MPTSDVFILNRAKELLDRGVPTDQAVERGIRSAASTVTSGAAMMIAVLAIFASLRQLDVKQLGVGLAVAVLIDATLIKDVLVPVAMKLLGDWNWYLPRWLESMPLLSTKPKPPTDILETSTSAGGGNRPRSKSSRRRVADVDSTAPRLTSISVRKEPARSAPPGDAAIGRSHWPFIG